MLGGHAGPDGGVSYCAGCVTIRQQTMKVGPPLGRIEDFSGAKPELKPDSQRLPGDPPSTSLAAHIKVRLIKDVHEVIARGEGVVKPAEPVPARGGQNKTAEHGAIGHLYCFQQRLHPLVWRMTRVGFFEGGDADLLSNPVQVFIGAADRRIEAGGKVVIHEDHTDRGKDCSEAGAESCLQLRAFGAIQRRKLPAGRHVGGKSDLDEGFQVVAVERPSRTLKPCPFFPAERFHKRKLQMFSH